MKAFYSKYFPYYTVLNESVLLLSHLLKENTHVAVYGLIFPIFTSNDFAAS